MECRRVEATGIDADTVLLASGKDIPAPRITLHVWAAPATPRAVGPLGREPRGRLRIMDEPYGAASARSFWSRSSSACSA